MVIKELKILILNLSAICNLIRFLYKKVGRKYDLNCNQFLLIHNIIELDVQVEKKRYDLFFFLCSSKY